MLASHKELAEIKVIRNWHDFKSLKVGWQNLLTQSDADNIFLTWEWINCWRKTQSSLIQPFIVVIEDEQQILAIAPFYIQDYRLVNLITYRSLRFVGDQGTGSEYSNFIVKAEESVELKTMLWEHLLSPDVKPFWDFIWFTNVSAWAEGGKSLLQSLASVKRLNCNQRTVEFGQTSLAPLEHDILPNLSRNQRATVNKTYRKLNKHGKLKMALTDQSSDLSSHLEQLFTLHNQHWKNAGLGTFQRRPELANFYRFFVPIAYEKGWLRLLRLESDDEIQAMQIGYVYNNNFLSIQEGFNPDFIPGTGQVLRHFSFKNCHQEGLKCYDFLGDYTEHKRRWLAEKKLGVDLFIWHDKTKNLPFRIKKIWPTGRYLKPILLSMKAN
jgi:CelD/BcsL family acetyltransferase involved in cellulose biosynthesis